MITFACHHDYIHGYIETYNWQNEITKDSCYYCYQCCIWAMGNINMHEKIEIVIVIMTATLGSQVWLWLLDFSDQSFMYKYNYYKTVNNYTWLWLPSMITPSLYTGTRGCLDTDKNVHNLQSILHHHTYDAAALVVLIDPGEKLIQIDPPMISRMFPDTTWQLCKRHFCARALFPLPLFSQSRWAPTITRGRHDHVMVTFTV